MLFNSFEFAVFLPIVFVIYWLFANRTLTTQNLFVLTASYLFYGWWDWRLLGLLMLSTGIDYYFKIENFKKTHCIKRFKMDSIYFRNIDHMNTQGAYRYKDNLINQHKIRN